MHRDSSGASWRSAFILHIRSSILQNLTVDGNHVYGRCCPASFFMLNGHSVGVSLFAAFIAGNDRGPCDRKSFTRRWGNSRRSLRGILTQLGLYSINLRIMGGKANQAISVDKYDLLVSSPLCKGSRIFNRNTIFVTALIIVILIAVLYWFFGTEIGCSHPCHRLQSETCHVPRASIPISTKILGLMISNGIVAFASGLYAQYQGFADVNAGRGAIVNRSRSRYQSVRLFFGKISQKTSVFKLFLRCLRRDHLLPGPSGCTLDGIKFQRF